MEETQLQHQPRLASLYNACACAKLAEEFRGRDIVLLDLTAITPIADYFVIATGTSVRQLVAMVEEIRVLMKARGEKPIGTEGQAGNPWVLQDYGDIIVHAFLPEARELYDLERLWADAVRVDWKAELAKLRAEEPANQTA